MLDVVYHVSFLTEEARQLAAVVAYVDPQLSQESGRIRNLWQPTIPFRAPLPFTVGEVLRLAPAIDPTQCLIAVCPGNLPGNAIDRRFLAIWGILYHGSKYWRLLAGRESAALSPPNCLTISTFAPGSITASTLGIILFRLRAGELLGLPLEELSDGHMGDFLKEAADALYHEVCQRLKRKRYDPRSDSDDHPRQQYFRTLTNIAKLTRNRRHGGTFVVIPDEIGPDDQRLTDRLTVKYPLTIPDVWEHLVHESIATWYYFHRKGHSRAEGRERREGAQEKIADFEQLVASLSGVDGAVVLTKRLKVLGFGAEITATSPSLRFVRVAEDPEGKKFSEKPIESFGTRHRSALRLCSSFEQSMCLVVSQDGAVRAIKRVGPHLYMWNDVSLGRFGL